MKKLMGLLLLVGFVSAPGFSQEEKSKHSWMFDLDAKMAQSGDTNVFDTAVGYGYQLNDDYQAVIRVNFGLERAKAGDEWSDWALNHYFSRAELLGPNLFELGGGWKFKMEYRYYFPSTSRMQDAGAYGRLQARSKISNEITSFLSLSVRNYVDVWINREQYQTNDPAHAGNRLWAYTFGLIPVFTLADGLTLSYAGFIAARQMGETLGSDAGMSWEYFIDNEIELLYTVAALDDLSVGVIYRNYTQWSESSDFTFQDKENEIGLRFSKTF